MWFLQDTGTITTLIDRASFFPIKHYFWLSYAFFTSNEQDPAFCTYKYLHQWRQAIFSYQQWLYCIQENVVHIVHLLSDQWTSSRRFHELTSMFVENRLCLTCWHCCITHHQNVWFDFLCFNSISSKSMTGVWTHYNATALHISHYTMRAPFSCLVFRNIQKKLDINGHNFVRLLLNCNL